MLEKFNQENENICVFSRGYVGRIKKFAPDFDVSKFVVIPNPNTSDISKESDLRHQKRNAVLFVGRLYNNPKNITDLLQVWKTFRENNQEWELHIVGDGPEKKRFEQYCISNKVKGVIFCGQQENVSDYYAQSKIFCLTSIHESWNLCLIEAMTKGCVPVAFGSYEAVTDIIDNGKNGYVVKPFKKKDMVACLDRLANDENLLKEMSTEAIKKSDAFDLQNIASQWEQLIQN